VLFLILTTAVDARFTYALYVCLLTTTLAIDWQAQKKAAVALMGILIVSSGFADASAIKIFYSKKGIDAAMYGASRELVDELKVIRSAAKPIYVVDDFVSGYSAEQNVARVAGMTSELDRANSLILDGCRAEDLDAVRYQVTHLPGQETDITTSIPKCASFEFEGGVPALISRRANGSEVARNEQVSYVIPELKFEHTISGKPSYDLGRVMTVRVHGASVLLYDFHKRQWMYIR
jgi:hypothetical protein